MTVKELKFIIDRQLKATPRYEDCEVVVETSEPSVGSLSCAAIVRAGFGFDWDSDKFLLHPKENLVKEDKNV